MYEPVTRLNAALEGRYRIESELGQGGMATVYLADDLRHERKVALKVLKPELAAVVGAERFLAEIKTTANLQHPHILPLHDSGEADGFLFYVMPYIEGETLRDRLEREKQLPVDEAVRIATDVAEALHSAHEQGVIHRDIKPANILLSRGRPLVADFGIALAVAQAGGGRLTETGLSMGTPYYMSPEQASADRAPSPASDVYSLGCVLYEMLVGEPPYVGSSAQAVLAKILTGEAPSPTASRSAIPANVDAAIRKALEKLPADRFTSTPEFARALSDPAFGTRDDVAAQLAGGSLRARLFPAMTVLAAAALVVAAWGWLRPAAPELIARYELAAPFDNLERAGLAYDLAPDGSWLVSAFPDGAEGGDDTEPRLWTKRRDQLDWVRLPGAPPAEHPRISPDGQRIAFLDLAEGALKVIPAAGGTPTRLDWAFAFGFEWLDDTSLVVPTQQGIILLPASGAANTELWTSSELRVFGAVTPLPDGRGVLVPLCSACPLDLAVYVLDFTSGSPSPLFPAAQGELVDGNVVLLLGYDGVLMAAPFDVEGRSLVSAPVPVMDGVAYTPAAPAAVFPSASGELLVILGPPGRPDVTQTYYEAVWVDRAGVETLAVDGPWQFQLANNFGHAISPDGSRLAIGLRTDAGDDVWIKELPAGPLTRLTLGDAAEARPRWSADGTHLLFHSNRSGQYELYRRRADGADAEAYVPTALRSIQETEASPDGEWLVSRVGGFEGRPDSGRDIVAYRTNGDSTEVPLLTSQYDEFTPRLSPDGRWLAYVSNESGTNEVYVRPFPNVGDGRWQISTRGGTLPVWRGDAAELYYVERPGGQRPRRFVAAGVAAGPTFSVQSRATLFEVSDRILLEQPWEPVVDVTSDGERFLLMRRVAEPARDEPHRLVLVENFVADVRLQVGAER